MNKRRAKELKKQAVQVALAFPDEHKEAVARSLYKIMKKQWSQRSKVK